MIKEPLDVIDTSNIETKIQKLAAISECINICHELIMIAVKIDEMTFLLRDNKLISMVEVESLFNDLKKAVVSKKQELAAFHLIL